MKFTWPIIAGVLGVAVYLVSTTSPTPDESNTDATPIDDAGNDPTMPIFDSLPASAIVRDFASAIAKAEGFGISGAIPTRAHNPGDLVMPGWKGATLGSQNISVFASDAEGWSHLWHQVQLMLSGHSRVYSPMMTIAEMARKWTGTQPNDWANNVAGWLQNNGYPDVTTDTVLGDLYAG